MKTLTTKAWGVMHKDGSLCVALIRRTKKEADQAQCDMFPHMTRAMFRQLGFTFRKVEITYRSNAALTGGNVPSNGVVGDVP